MPRRKNLKIDDYTDNTHGRSIPIYLTPDDKFFAKVGSDQIEANTRGELDQAIRQSIKDQFSVLWQAVVNVEMMEPFAHNRKDDSIGVDFHRFYIGRREDGHFVHVDWDIAEEDRYQNMKPYAYTKGRYKKFNFPLVEPFELDEAFHQEFLLPYSDATWQALEKLREMIQQMNARLAQLLGTPEGHKQLSTIGEYLLRALPAPTEESETE